MLLGKTYGFRLHLSRQKTAECYQHQQLNPDASVSPDNPQRGRWSKRTRQNETKSDDLIYSNHSCCTNLLSVHRRHLGWKINTILSGHNGTDRMVWATAGSPAGQCSKTALSTLGIQLPTHYFPIPVITHNTPGVNAGPIISPFVLFVPSVLVILTLQVVVEF